MDRLVACLAGSMISFFSFSDYWSNGTGGRDSGIGSSACFREGDKKGFHTFPLPSFQYVVILEEGIGPNKKGTQTNQSSYWSLSSTESDTSILFTRYHSIPFYLRFGVKASTKPRNSKSKKWNSQVDQADCEISNLL